MRTGIWTYRDPRFATIDVVGFEVHALDGRIGKVAEASSEVARSYVLVDTGPWVFGKRHFLPAGIVNRIDEVHRTVFVNQTREDIENAPEYDPDEGPDEQYRTELGDYYSVQVRRGLTADGSLLG